MHMLKTIKKLVKMYCQPAHKMKEEHGSNCSVWPCEVMVIRSSVDDCGLENDSWTSWAYSPFWLKWFLIVK